jgi:hypothetical protein
MSTIKDVAAELEQAGKFIAAQIEKARGYEADAKEKVEHALKRADDHWTSVAQRLSEARKLCFESKQNFDDFKKKYAPDLSRTTIYRLTSIGAGTLSIEEQRKTWREEKREKRAAAKESRTKMSGIDEAARKQVEGVIANLPSSWGDAGGKRRHLDLTRWRGVPRKAVAPCGASADSRTIAGARTGADSSAANGAEGYQRRSGRTGA